MTRSPSLISVWDIMQDALPTSFQLPLIAYIWESDGSLIVKAKNKCGIIGVAEFVRSGVVMEVGNPHPTIYIQNLNEKASPKDVKATLTEWFAPHGSLVSVVVKRRLALRGQAWIQFDSTDAAQRAIKAMQGKRLFGKSMVLRFAKFKSDAVAKADGSYEVEKYHRDQDKRTTCP